MPNGIMKVGIWEDGKRMRWIEQVNPSMSTHENMLE
jgi:hypothetical protein